MKRVDASNPSFLVGLTPLNWAAYEGGVLSTVAGAGWSASFDQLDELQLLVDVSSFESAKFPASRYPVLAWSLDGVEQPPVQLEPGIQRLPLARSRCTTIDLYVRGMSPYEDRWGSAERLPVNSIRVAGIEMNDSATLLTPADARPLWLTIGDSICSGDRALGPCDIEDWARFNDARASYSYLLSREFGYREAKLAWGGYEWTAGLAGIPAVPEMIASVVAGVPRLRSGKFDPMPRIAFICLGENGRPAANDVQAGLAAIRAAILPETSLLVAVPIAGTNRAVVSDGFLRHQQTHDDRFAKLIDLGWQDNTPFLTADGQHPTASGHVQIFSRLLRVAAAILDAPLL